MVPEELAAREREQHEYVPAFEISRKKLEDIVAKAKESSRGKHMVDFSAVLDQADTAVRWKDVYNPPAYFKSDLIRFHTVNVSDHLENLDAVQNDITLAEAIDSDKWAWRFKTYLEPDNPSPELQP